MTDAYYGESYLKLEDLYKRYQELADQNPQWMRIESIASTRAGHDILLITLSNHLDQDQQEVSSEALLARPALWIDAGTHAAEWAGVSGALYDLECWLEMIDGHRGKQIQAKEQAWFTDHAIYLVPLICPDGYEALWGQRPYLRSTLRDSRGDLIEIGMTPHDLDGDGVTRWMRWQHPAGSFVEDSEYPGLMRGRQLDDDPNEAYFMCMEGSFQLWDGWRWEEAPRPWIEGLDLNRNFPAHWQNFTMFGMDGGSYPLSEIESRAVVDAFSNRPRIAAALTYHTFTGALLTQPYRKNTPLNKSDIRLMKAIGEQAVEGTDYRVIKIHPDFVYDDDAEVVGVWSDTLSTVFGVPGYTLELWDPFKYHGLENHHPARFFSDPDPLLIRGLTLGFQQTPGAWADWQSFDHPQLGTVELGGLDFMMTIRNPPHAELPREVQKSHQVAERMRRVLPKVNAELKATIIDANTNAHDDLSQPHLYKLQLTLENFGFLSTSALQQGKKWSPCPQVSATLKVDDQNTRLISGLKSKPHPHLNGWGEASLGLGGLSPSLSEHGHRALFEWIIEAKSNTVVTVRWSAGRGGAGNVQLELE